MKKVLWFVFLMFFMASCGYQEGIVQKSDKSFLRFTGNTQNVSVQIDDAAPFSLGTEVSQESSSNRMLYQVSPGKHTVKVYRQNRLIVNRILFLDSQVTQEVDIP